MEVKDLIVLNEKDQNTIADVPNLFKNHLIAHSEFQIKNFILNDRDYPTAEGKYHQAVRELWSRYQNLISLTHEYGKLKNEIKLHCLAMEELTLEMNEYDLNIHRQRIISEKISIHIDQERLDYRHKSLQLVSLEKKASETVREVSVLMEMIEKLDEFIDDRFRDASGMPDRELSEERFWLAKQMIAEHLCDGDIDKTPFRRLLGLADGEKPIIARDKLGRMVFINPNEAKLLQRNENV